MKRIGLLALTIIFALAAGGCFLFDANDSENSQRPGKYAKEFRGEWIRMDTGERWYISGNSIKVNGEEKSPNVTLKKPSENVTVATEGNSKYTLFAARVANASFNAQIVLLDDIPRSAIGSRTVGDERVIVRNPKQPDLPELVLQPDPNTGGIIVSNQIPGDQIEIVPISSAWGDIKIELTPDFGENQDMGAIPLTYGDNFKVSLVQDPEIVDYYADGVPHEYVFELENIGTTNCGDSGFELSWDSNDFYRSGGYGDVKATFANIKPGDKKQLKVTLGSNPIDTEVKNKKIKVGIWNYDSKSKKTRRWEDTVSITYHSAPVPFRLRSMKQVQGVIKAKNGKSYYFKTEKQGEAGDFTAAVEVPWSLDEYTVAFLGASVETGSATHYSFAVDDQPPSDWSMRPIDFLRKYKPANESENTAPVVDLTQGENSFIGYLAGDSVDYYKVRMNREMPESARIIDLEDWAFKDEGVYVDGKANPGEDLYFDFKFKNVSTQNRTIYINSLTSDSPYVKDNYGGRSLVLQPGYYGATASGITSAVSSDVALLNNSDNTWYYRHIKLASNCPEGPLQLTLKLGDNMNLQYERKITIQVYLSDILAAPTNLKAEYPSEGSVRFIWDKVTGAEGYHVYFDDVLVNLDSNTTQYERSGLELGMTYSFNVCAISGGKEHGVSSLNIKGPGLLVFNKRYVFFKDDIDTSGEITDRAPIFKFYVASGASYTTYALQNDVYFGIWYEGNNRDEADAYISVNVNYESSKSYTWVSGRTGWAYIKLLDSGYKFSFMITHPEPAVSAFSVNGISGVINETSKTITVNVPADTDLSNVTPVVTAASNWTCNTGGAKNLNTPAEFIFSRENDKQAYLVTVMKMEE